MRYGVMCKGFNAYRCSTYVAGTGKGNHIEKNHRALQRKSTALLSLIQLCKRRKRARRLEGVT